MNVGIAVTSGVKDLRRVDTGLLRSLGFSGVFVVCYEDEVRWHVEDIAAFVRKARSDGLEPYAVPYGYGRFLDPDASVESLYITTHPDTCQVDTRGRRVPRACPNHPRFLEWFSSSMRTLAWLLEVRGFLWDEPSFHYARGQWACHCHYCSRLFRAGYGHDMPRELTDEALEFRRNSVLMFILAAAAAIQSVDRKLGSLVMPLPAPAGQSSTAGAEGLQDLVGCSGVDGLFSLVPWQDLGWDMEHAVREAVDGHGKLAHRHGKASALWLTASPAREDRIVDTVTYAARVGADALVLADYHSLITAPGFAAIREPLHAALTAAASRQARQAQIR